MLKVFLTHFHTGAGGYPQVYAAVKDPLIVPEPEFERITFGLLLAHKCLVAKVGGKPRIHLKYFCMGPIKRSLATATSRLSTVEAGTLYEEHVFRVLSKYGFELSRRGGPNDRGIDLCGSIRDVPVIVQCKHYEAHLTPAVIRELYGVIAAHPNNFGLLVCSGGVREGSLSFLQSAALPMGIMTLQSEEQAAYPTSLTLNQPARRVLPFLRQTAVYYINGSGVNAKGIELKIS